jgi:hypothetical protein
MLPSDGALSPPAHPPFERAARFPRLLRAFPQFESVGDLLTNAETRPAPGPARLRVLLENLGPTSRTTDSRQPSSLSPFFLSYDHSDLVITCLCTPTLSAGDAHTLCSPVVRTRHDESQAEGGPGRACCDLAWSGDSAQTFIRLNGE